jgi:glycosyltransferase involved in cell wall biosynthesis
MMQKQKTTILFYFDVNNSKSSLKTLNSVLQLHHKNYKLSILSTDQDKCAEICAEQIDHKTPVAYRTFSPETPADSLYSAFETIDTPFLLFINNQNTQIILKQSSLDLFLTAANRNNDFSYIYSDYTLKDGKTVKELRLLKHHMGRVRDNQDYGYVYFINYKHLKNANFIYKTVQFNPLYDMRLRLSEQAAPLHIANRYSGALYEAVAAAKSHNVFDYLMASKNSQKEAEALLSDHLKRMGAYLTAGEHYSERPSAPDEAVLEASVIIPVNDRPQFIGLAIESIQAQTVQNIEAIIIVNGGDKDPTIDEVKRYMKGGDRYKPQKPQVRLVVMDINNLGLCLNYGAEIAKGKYYVQLDSDDQLTKDAVEKTLNVYKQDPTIGMVIGSYEVWEQKENGAIVKLENLPVVTHDEWTEENGRNNLLRINGAGAPRSIPIQLIREVGFSVNEEPYARNYGEDYHMVLTISEKHRIGRVWEAIYKVVRHSGGTDHNIDQTTIDRNDEAKDHMRLQAINRRIQLNK